MSIIVFFVILIVFFLPYTNSLILNIGFPLKVYEILGILLITVIFLNLIINQKSSLRINSQEKKLYKWLMLFFVWYCFSGMFSFFILNEITFPQWATGRHAPFISVVTKLVYLFLNISLFFVVVCFISRKTLLIKIIRIWIISSLLVSIYALYLFIFSLLNIKPIFIPGTELPMQYAILPSIGTFIRNATFKEGNFFGGYIVVSIMMTLPFLFVKHKSINHLSKKFLSFAFILQICGLLISLSTINFISFIISISIFFKMTYLQGLKIKKKFFFPVCFIMFLILIFVFSPLSRLVIFERIFGNDPYWSYSKKDRFESIRTAFNMFYHNPIFGVGPTNYGFFYDLYKPSQLFDGSKGKRIVNNIYAEILCESGAPGLLLFLLFILLVIKLYFARKNLIESNFTPITNALFCAFISMLIAFLAYPTFTLTYHWILMGLLISSTKVVEQKESI